MRKIYPVFVYLLVAILLCAWNLPPADTAMMPPSTAKFVKSNIVKLTIVNRTGLPIDSYRLSGVAHYTFSKIPVGKSTFNVVKGRYFIRYYACGKTRSMKIDLDLRLQYSTVTCK